MATRVIGGSTSRLSPDAGYIEHVNQKLGELVDFRGKLIGLLEHYWVVVKQIEIEHPHHGGAGTGGDHNVGSVLETEEHPPGQLAGLGSEPGVKEGLATTSLVGWEVYRHSQMSEHPDHTDAYFRVKLVNDAGDVKRCFWAWGSGQYDLVRTDIMLVRVSDGVLGGNRNRYVVVVHFAGKVMGSVHHTGEGRCPYTVVTEIRQWIPAQAGMERTRLNL